MSRREGPLRRLECSGCIHHQRLHYRFDEEDAELFHACAHPERIVCGISCLIGDTSETPSWCPCLSLPMVPANAATACAHG